MIWKIIMNFAAYLGKYLKKNPPNTADNTGSATNITNESKNVRSPAERKYTIGSTIVVIIAKMIPIFAMLYHLFIGCVGLGEILIDIHDIHRVDGVQEEVKRR